jgi:KDO2-lipid IV(A) lauroyltransferase
MSVIYAPEGRSALYQWQRRMQTRVGNAVLLWMGRHYRRIPERAGYRLGAAIGTLMRGISPRHHRIVMTNLRLAFGQEKGEAELRQIAAECYRHLGKCLIEFIRLPALSEADITSRVEMRGSEHLEAALARGRGAIVLTGHLGNWEMLGARIAAAGYRLNVIARPQRDSTLTEYIRRTREVAGMRVLHQEVAVRRSLLALRRNELVGILLDQNAGDEGLFVDFFGRPASTAPGAAAFALRTGAPVLPSFGWRNADDTHTAVIEPPLPVIRTGDREQDLLVNTARFTKVIEERIREHPAQWFWLHKRWKSRPPGERRG